jgi:5-methylcytosine-specific restriction endonuclease McrA
MPAARKRTRKPVTPPSRIRSVLRRAIWLYSRERAEALKRDGRKCRACGSKEQLEVHHLDGSGIDEIIELIYKMLLCNPDRLITLCSTCHKTAGEAPESTIGCKKVSDYGL